MSKKEENYTYSVNLGEVDWRPVLDEFDAEGNILGPKELTPEDEEKMKVLRFWGAHVTVHCDGGPFMAALQSPTYRKDSSEEKFLALMNLNTLIGTMLMGFGDPSAQPEVTNACN